MPYPVENSADGARAVVKGGFQYKMNGKKMTRKIEDAKDGNRNVDNSYSSVHVCGKLVASNLSEVILHSLSLSDSEKKIKEPYRSEFKNTRGYFEMSSDESKVFNDCIHDYISFPELCVCIIDTPEFQRLRRLRQLGVTHYVYPNATHTRFQHCLGVGHLAGEFARCIQRQDPNLVSDVDILCLQIAGLCHDLGHGPFSHLWEVFMSRANAKQKWTHEENSIKIFDKLIEKNGLGPLFKKNGLNENDIIFIKEAIGGPLGDDGRTYKGRGPEKYFLYEIVANKTTGIDVDKLDYFQRDEYYLNVGTVFKYERLVHFMKVFEVNGKNRLCIRDKEAKCLSDIFMDRSRLHDRAYQHRVVQNIQQMVLDALILAEPVITIKNSKKNLISLSEATHDLDAFQLLVDDYIFFKIMDSDDPRIVPAQNLLRRIETRDFYSLVSEWTPPHGLTLSKKLNLNKMLDVFTQVHPIPDSWGLSIKDFGLAFKVIDLGEGDKKRKVIFYDKNNCITNEIGIHGLINVPSVTLYFLMKESSQIINPNVHEIVRKWIRYLENNIESCLTDM
uniref:HD/PDEase domain-containing protein n=1 Tax=Lepeophtheirus salmonis TaxID=72036 RepID=A0A0K2UFL3_LEPSM